MGRDIPAHVSPPRQACKRKSHFEFGDPFGNFKGVRHGMVWRQNIETAIKSMDMDLAPIAISVNCQKDFTAAVILNVARRGVGNDRPTIRWQTVA